MPKNGPYEVVTRANLKPHRMWDVGGNLDARPYL